MRSLLYQFSSVYAAGILGYPGHPTSQKYAPILNVRVLTGIDHEGRRKVVMYESSNLLPGKY